MSSHDRFLRWLLRRCLFVLGVIQTGDLGAAYIPVIINHADANAQVSVNGDTPFGVGQGGTESGPPQAGNFGVVWTYVSGPDAGFTGGIGINVAGGNPAYVTITGPTFGDFNVAIELTGALFSAPAPTEWHLDEVIENDSTTARRYQLDTDCDGIADTTFTIPAGGSHRVQIASDVAPCGDIIISVETYQGDAQWSFEETGRIDEGQWNPSTPPPGPSTNSIVAPNPPPDTRSHTNALVTFPAPGTNAVADNTFRTGVEALRRAQIDKSDEIIEAIDRLRRDATNALGAGLDTNAITAAIPGRASGGSNAIKLAALSFTNAFGATNTGGLLIAGSEPPLDRRSIPVGASASLGRVNIDPRDYPLVIEFFTFAKSILTWLIWMLYGIWLVFHCMRGLWAASQAPSGSSGGTPLFSSILAGFAALFVAAILLGATFALSFFVQGLLAESIFSDKSIWRTWPYLAEAVWWAELCSPLSLVFTLIIASIPTRLAIDGTILAVMSAIRLTTA